MDSNIKLKIDLLIETCTNYANYLMLKIENNDNKTGRERGRENHKTGWVGEEMQT